MPHWCVLKSIICSRVANTTRASSMQWPYSKQEVRGLHMRISQEINFLLFLITILEQFILVRVVDMIIVSVLIAQKTVGLLCCSWEDGSTQCLEKGQNWLHHIDMGDIDCVYMMCDMWRNIESCEWLICGLLGEEKMAGNKKSKNGESAWRKKCALKLLHSSSSIGTGERFLNPWSKNRGGANWDEKYIIVLVERFGHVNGGLVLMVEVWVRWTLELFCIGVKNMGRYLVALMGFQTLILFNKWGDENHDHASVMNQFCGQKQTFLNWPKCFFYYFFVGGEEKKVVIFFYIIVLAQGLPPINQWIMLQTIFLGVLGTHWVVYCRVLKTFFRWIFDNSSSPGLGVEFFCAPPSKYIWS